MSAHALQSDSRAIPGLGWVAIAIAWLVAAIAELSGGAGMLHHHALIEGGPPLSVSLLLFSAGWLVMVVAMMLPSTLGAISRYRLALASRSTVPVIAFVAAFLASWLLVGLVFFMGDVAVHWIVDSSPWIAERSWLMEAGLVGFAGVYQFAPVKRRSLEACRHPIVASHTERSGLSAGAAHAIACLGSSGPMMLLMFAAGLANIWWMLGLAAVMAYEARGLHGLRVASIAGGGFIALALLALTHSGLPAWA